MALLVDTAVGLLSKEIGDYHVGETTVNGDSNAMFLISDYFYEKTPEWVVDGMTVRLPTGPAGISDPEVRVVDRIDGNRLYVKTAFSAQVISGITFELHRLFTYNKKSLAVQAVDLDIFPDVFDVVRDNSTLVVVDDQWEYDISSMGIWRNRPHQVLVEQNPDDADYPYLPLHDWDVTPDGKLRLNFTLTAGLKLCVVGIKPVLWSGGSIDLDDSETKILVVAAGVWLIETAIAETTSQNTEKFQGMLGRMTQKLAEYKQKFWKAAPPATIISGAGLEV